MQSEITTVFAQQMSEMMSEIRQQRQQMEDLKERDRQKQVDELQKQI